MQRFLQLLPSRQVSNKKHQIFVVCERTWDDIKTNNKFQVVLNSFVSHLNGIFHILWDLRMEGKGEKIELSFFLCNEREWESKERITIKRRNRKQLNKLHKRNLDLDTFVGFISFRFNAFNVGSTLVSSSVALEYSKKINSAPMYRLLAQVEFMSWAYCSISSTLFNLLISRRVSRLESSSLASRLANK